MYDVMGISILQYFKSRYSCGRIETERRVLAMNTKEILHVPLPSAEDLREAKFRVWETQFPETDGHAALVSFEGRYPSEEGMKALNKKASITFVVVQGEGICYSLEGNGKAFQFRAGDFVRIPRMSYYLLFATGRAVLAAVSFPMFEERDRQVDQLTDEDIAVLHRLGASLQF